VATRADASQQVEAAAQRVVTRPGTADEVQDRVEQLHQAIKEMNQVMDALNVSPRFEVHQSTDELQVVLAQRDTGEVIRKIPPDEVLERRELLSRLVGATFDVTT
jgi:flagellar protein FlaG